MLVPDDGAGEVRQLSVEVRTIQRAVVGLSVVVGLLAATSVAGLLSWPRVQHSQAMMEENLTLKARLQDIEGELDSVEGTLERVRLYDAQLRDVLRDNPMFEGGTGGVELPTLEDEVSLDELEEDFEAMVFEADDLRPAELWAMSVQARTDEYVDRLESLEPRLSLLAEDVEDLLSIREAFPSEWPVDGILTSTFGYRRSPFNNQWKWHSGVDISAPRGTRVYATSPGKIVMARMNAGYGRMVEIDHGYGLTTRYAHNSSLFVREGDWVEAGQVIATVGTTGQSTGPHLHLELRVDGEAVDPLEYLPK